MKIFYTIGIAILAPAAAEAKNKVCKTTPDSPSWPSPDIWNAFNNTLGGALISPTPPAAPCYPPHFDNATCTKIQSEWNGDWNLYVEDPVGNAYNNWNNDTCLPYPSLGAPCTGEGYPVYVVNATTAEHVSCAVNFARKYKIRLNVKNTGHDFLGRSVAPKSLSIWVHYIKEGEFHRDTFTVAGKNCSKTYNTSAVTVGGGSSHAEAFKTAVSNGQMIPVGGGPTVGVGGYATGGGHSAMSSTYGLASDAVLELTVVTPDGKIITVNECSDPDLFWAFRGGGGSTFGVVTSLTYKTWPLVGGTNWVTVVTANNTGNSPEPIYDTVACVASMMPGLAEKGLMAYTQLNNAPGSPAVYSLAFTGLGKSKEYTNGLLQPILDYIKKNHADTTTVAHEEPEVFSSFYDYWVANPDDTTPSGVDIVVASRLLDREALQSPKFRDLVPKAGPSLGMFLVGGPGVHNKSADFNAVNPGWRTSYVHSISGVGWVPFNKTMQDEQMSLLMNNYTVALHEMSPNTGCYINEANPFEPNRNKEFWGSNYARLLAIKRKVDPQDVFWCRACVGNDRWEEVGDELCQT